VSVFSATRSAQSIAAGVDPQSSCSFRPHAPASICSIRAGSRESFPLHKNPKLSGSSSTASIILWMFQAPGVHVVAFVPSAGPVPPPIIVVVPLQIASIACCGEIKWMWESMVPGVQIVCSPATISVLEEMTMSTSSMTFGFPALPIPTILPSFMPMSALMIPRIGSSITAFVIARSSEFSLETPLACAIPSRALFPPPNTVSSPCFIKSLSISTIRSVSASLILSPAVGPKRSTYFLLGIRRVMLPSPRIPRPLLSAAPRISSLLAGR